MIRFLDIVFSALGLLALSPLFLVVYVIIRIESKGAGFYSQKRVGKNGVLFSIYKFRSMRIDADKHGLITVGGCDPRITRTGYYIRKYKIDELPQLWNVLIGDMSLVGPRPEVQKYVDLYSDEQRKVLSVRPGITDYASIEYADENTLLGNSDDPDRTYVEIVMPAKIELNMRYINNKSLKEYFKIIFLTMAKIVG
ncbi:sugar transferase [Prevotella sp. OH937_COT-195]|uniref:sugar transferase n=1 Tax=Prevotella sp. OH937_COT-195 TaxID=2491051 RepID=UPI000F64E908|nr:sugar transferase [Prevotella sp. OH937_COT-195]RRD02778.1 sugar transferase [Prevotella sp. OH937_COT-195]